MLIETERHGPHVVLNLNRPEKLNALNYALVMVFQGVFPGWPEAVIAVVQVFIAFFKFGLYHYWVYPGERKRYEV